jgi:hypothetical protein
MDDSAKNELKVSVVIDLAAICKKVAESPIVPDDIRTQARKYVEEVNSLLPARGKGTPLEHAQGEHLLIEMARFLPKIVEIQSLPSTSGSFEGEE